MLLQDRVMTYDLAKVESVKVGHGVLSLNFGSGSVNIRILPEQQLAITGADVFRFIFALIKRRDQGVMALTPTEFIKQFMEW